MDIVGIGTDACEIDRIAASLAKYGDRFLKKIYTDGEIAYCRRKRDPAPSLAARFAAKEAASKALGTGLSRGVFWTDISFAPLWNFRSILIAAGESCEGAVVEVESHCATSDVRGSFRYRLGL